MKGLESVYGLDFAGFRPLDAGVPITVAALEGDEIQVGLMFTSDGTILAKGFVLLEDDMALQPSENIAPAVRDDIIDEYRDEFAAVLNAVSAQLAATGIVSRWRRSGRGAESLRAGSMPRPSTRSGLVSSVPRLPRC